MKILDKIFRPYDIRGTYPKELNESVVESIAESLANFLVGSKSLMVGHDARTSSPALYNALLRGLRKNKDCTVHEAGLITTPMLTFLTVTHECDFGIIVTASHNPKEYNGIKMITKDAMSVPGTEIKKIVKQNTR